MHLSIYN